MNINPNILSLLNTIGTWLASIATVSAVIVALYLARRDAKIKLKIHVGHRILITPGEKGRPDYCSISITNIGFRKVTINNIGWKVGLYKKRFAVQTLWPFPLNSPLPVQLDDGQEAKYLIPFQAQGNYPNWIDDFSKDFLNPNIWLSANTLKLQVSTSLDKTFEVKIEKGLREKLIEAAKHTDH
jgi:hypothetical protein